MPVIVDAGVGTASDAAVAMELGCHGVLMNTAIAHAKDPVLMAEAMREGVRAGRKAFLAGRMPTARYANASSPTSGISRVECTRSVAAMLSRAALAASCGRAAAVRAHPEAELREDETPGDALWQLAQKFHDEHTTSRPRRRTLEYLVERYPASRWHVARAGRARAARRRGADAGASAGG